MMLRGTELEVVIRLDSPAPEAVFPIDSSSRVCWVSTDANDEGISYSCCRTNPHLGFAAREDSNIPNERRDYMCRR